MSGVPVEVSRIPDRDELLRLLAEQGIEARPVDEPDWIGVEVPCDGEANEACAQVVHQLETWLSEASVPLVPVKGDGRVFLRPPGD